MKGEIMTKEERTNQLKRRGALTGIAAVSILAAAISMKHSQPVNADEYREMISPQQIYIVNSPDREEIQEVDPAERELLAHVIYAEAGTCSEQAQYYVGSVVLNRVKDDSYPDTMTKVVYQQEPSIQYGCTVDGNIDKEPTTRAYEIADELLRYGSIVPSNVVFQSEYIQGTGTWKSIDGIYFCYK